MLFLDADQTVATFQLKPFFPVPQRGRYFSEIVKDFGKQYKKAMSDSLVEHYVVLVPCDEPGQIEAWTRKELEARVQREFPGIVVNEIAASKPIRLNNEEHGCVLVKIFRVRAG